MALARTSTTVKEGLYPVNTPIEERSMFGRVMKQWRDFEEEEAKKNKEKLEMYINLRKAGYSAEEAHKAARAGQIPSNLPTGGVYDVETKQKEVNLQKSTLEKERLEAQKEQGWKRPSTFTPQQQRDIDISKQYAISEIERGYFLDEDGKKVPLNTREEMESNIINNFDVDLKDPDIQAALNKYAPEHLPGTTPFENIQKPATFLGMGKKYPRATHKKYNREYEQREDGRWYLVE